MIITCPCEKKQFKIDSSLIPQEGRELQCGSCERVWFYKPKNESEAPLTLNENISENKIEPAIKTNDKNLEFSKNLQKEKIIEPEKKNKTSKEIPKVVQLNFGSNTTYHSTLIFIWRNMRLSFEVTSYREVYFHFRKLRLAPFLNRRFRQFVARDCLASRFVEVFVRCWHEKKRGEMILDAAKYREEASADIDFLVAQVP